MTPADRMTGAAPGRGLIQILAAIALAAVAVPAMLVAYAPPVVPHRRVVLPHLPPTRIVPPAELPPVEPVTVADLAPEDARSFNAAVPFVTGANPPARAFLIGEGGEDAARATDCLAAAAYYEAGDDAPGERAVAQVVLNRVRHPAFPKTVCGVVFQGQEKSTGCQFTFSCDGSMTRYHPTDAAWKRARAVAAMALHGSVYAPVGWATHYHADYVVPYWQASLDKLAEVHTQLFYRWSGWWGTPPAFRGRLQPGEPAVAQLATLSEAHRTAAAAAEVDAAETEAAAIVGSSPIQLPGEEGTYLAALPPGTAPDGYPALAAQACGDRAFCRYLAWRDKRIVPTRLPLDAGEIADMSFSYVRDRSSAYEKALWNCHDTVRRDPRECMKQAGPAVPPPAPAASATPAPAGPAELDGIRRKPAPPATSAAPANTSAAAPH